MRRRHFVTALGSVGAIAIAGCTGDDDSDGGADDEEIDGTDTPTPNATTGTPADTTESGDTDDPAAEAIAPGAERTVAALLTAERSDGVVRNLHPAHPRHPSNTDGEDPNPFAATAVETTLVTEDAGVDDLLGVRTLSDALSAERVERAVDGERAAVVDATATVSGSEVRLRFATVTGDGEWRVLVIGVPDPDATDSVFDVRVVEGVSFDADEDRARVQFVDAPIADRVTVETENTESYRETDTPSGIAYLDIYPDPAGDELTVTAAVDGDETLVRRERYPPEDRIVDDVRYETDGRAQAIVEFGDVGDLDGLSARATRSGGETTLTDGASDAEFLGVTIDPAGDQVVVTATDDGTTTEVHRERYHP